MSHQFSWDYIIFWSSVLTVLVISHKVSGLLTDSNDLHCTQIQCPKKCPEDSYLKSALDDEEDDFEDYEDELLGHDPYLEEVDHFEEIAPLEEVHDVHSPQYFQRERQKREVSFQEDIEMCCGNQKCICNQCPDVPKCAEGYVAVEIHDGQAVPGNCCSTFRCIKKEECQLGMKQSWWIKKCTKCSCFGENELCMQICPEEEVLQNCYSEYWQKPMMNGAFWKEGSCTSCSCEQGERRCFTPVCPKLDCNETARFEDECCAKCIDDLMDIRTEIINNEGNDIDYDLEEEYSTEAVTIDTPIASINDDHNSTISPDHRSYPIVNETQTTIVNETQTTSPIMEAQENSTYSIYSEVTNQISSTSAVETVKSTASTNPSNYILTHVYQSSSTTQEEHDSAITVNTTTTTPTATTEQLEYLPESELNSSTTIASIDDPKATKITEQNFSLNVINGQEVHTLQISEEPTTEDTLHADYVMRNSTRENIIIITDPTATSSIAFETSTIATASSPALESTTNNVISSATKSKTFTTPSTRNTPSETTSSPQSTTFSTSTSSEYPKTTSTSTTSSPYSITTVFTTTSNIEESISTSSATSPEPLRPVIPSYGDFVTDANGNSSTQGQMRIIFDEIDYVIMIVLFIGSLLCISLGLIIRHTKNRKKMYSVVPNSETSLSQTSTNTVLTV